MRPLCALLLASRIDVASCVDRCRVRLLTLPKMRAYNDDQETILFVGHSSIPWRSVAGLSIRDALAECLDLAWHLPPRSRRLCIGQLVIAWWLPDRRIKPAEREPCPGCGDPSPPDLNCICWRSAAP